MKLINYRSPDFRELFLRLDEGFASSVDGSIGNVTEETGTWD